jgi:sugar/nucleoside kinase (ribokinase family)
VKLALKLAEGRGTDVLAIGENSMDLVALVGGHPQANAKMPLLDYLELPGGEAASAAVGLVRLGWRAAYVGRFGDDRLGHQCRTAIAREGVDLTHAITMPDTPNRMAVIVVDRTTGDRTVLWRRADNLALQPEDVSDRTLRDCRVVLLGSDDVATMTTVARRARQFGVRTIADLEHVHRGTPDLLRQLDVAIMAASFPEKVTGAGSLGAALREVAALARAPLVCVTLGSDGCLALAGSQEIRVPAFRVDVVDTTGAGDLFRAGFIARWLAEPVAPDITELLRYANAAAALNCRAIGAFTAAPSRSAVEALVRS